MKKKNKKISVKTVIKVFVWLVVLAGLIWLVRYSLRQYDEGQAELGIMVCNETECINAIHIHSDVEFDLCGEHYTLPREAGPLDGLHTHKEKNYLHFHDEVELDVETHEQQPDQRLSLQEVIDIFELDPMEHCGRPDVEVIGLINGEAKPLDTNWIDGDDIKIIFK